MHRPVIVTFKRKDRRPEPHKDKTEIVRAAIHRDIHFTQVSDVDDPDTGYDVNSFHAPVVTLTVTDKEATALRFDPNVESVEDDGPVRALGTMIFESQPALDAETVPAGLSRINAPLAWEVTRGKGIKVAVMDTGIDSAHPDLVGNYRGGVSFVPSETSPTDYNRHGTHVAGTIAAAMTGSGVVGVAPNVYLYAVKVLDRYGSGYWSWFIAGLDWCRKNGIHIANMSLGNSTAPASVKAMCDAAYQDGVLLIAAAGNNAGTVEHPARYPSVMAVSALDTTDKLAWFSSRGPEVDICAPGVDILSTTTGQGYVRLNGTSMAAPHVAGAAALAWSTHRYAPAGMTANVAIRRLLCMTADAVMGEGRNYHFGHGRVNAEKAAFEFAVPES